MKTSFLINNIIISSLILFLTACGGGDSSNEDEKAISSVPAGIYEGTVTLSGSTGIMH